MRVLPELKVKPRDLSTRLDGGPLDKPAVFLDQFFDSGLDDAATDIVEISLLFLCSIHRGAEILNGIFGYPTVPIVHEQFQEPP